MNVQRIENTEEMRIVIGEVSDETLEAACGCSNAMPTSPPNAGCGYATVGWCVSN
jgi:hypothetical protein